MILDSATGNRTPGICVTGRDVTNYTIADLIVTAYVYGYKKILIGCRKKNFL